MKVRAILPGFFFVFIFGVIPAIAQDMPELPSDYLTWDVVNEGPLPAMYKGIPVQVYLKAYQKTIEFKEGYALRSDILTVLLPDGAIPWCFAVWTIQKSSVNAEGVMEIATGSSLYDFGKNFGQEWEFKEVVTDLSQEEVFGKYNLEPIRIDSIFSQDEVGMPDVSTWNRVSTLPRDLSKTFLYNGKETAVALDQWDIIIGRTSGLTLVVYYKPEDGTEWFAVYVGQWIDEATGQPRWEERIFEPAGNNTWTPVARIRNDSEENELFTSRYNLGFVAERQSF